MKLNSAYGCALGAAQNVVYMSVSSQTFKTLRNLPEFARRVAADNGEEHIEVSSSGASLYLYHAGDEDNAAGTETSC